MPRIPLAAILRSILINIVVASGPALASIVPDDHPTIQAAIDAGADEILVRPGVYPERPVIPRPLVIRALVQSGSTDRPEIAGLALHDTTAPSYTYTLTSIELSNLRFTAPVTYAFDGDPYYHGSQTIAFEGCVLDSGVTDSLALWREYLIWSFHRCSIRGVIRIKGSADIAMVDSSEIEGSVDVSCEMWIRVCGNSIRGSAPYGIHTGGNGSVLVQGNDVSGFTTGILASGGYDTQTVAVQDNRVEDCGSFGIIDYASDIAVVTGNQVRRCGGGILAYGATWTCDRNIVENCGSGVRGFIGEWAHVGANVVRDCGGGIVVLGGSEDFVAVEDNRVEHCQGGIETNEVGVGRADRDTIVDCDRGLSIAASFLHVRGGRILSCRAPGVTAKGDWLEVRGNVVGHCQGDGFDLASGVGIDITNPIRLQLQGNTSHSNTGNGFDLDRGSSSAADSVDHNVTYRNHGVGFVLGDSNPVVWSCNDWFGDELGATSGHPPDASDLAVDPLFCNSGADDVHLAIDSPLADAPGCGLTGALGVACGENAALVVPPVGAPARFSLTVSPNPAQGPLRVEFTLTSAAPIAIDLIDVAGRNVASLARGWRPAGRNTVEWSARGLRPGLYLLRYRFPGGQQVRGVTIVR